MRPLMHFLAGLASVVLLFADHKLSSATQIESKGPSQVSRFQVTLTPPPAPTVPAIPDIRGTWSINRYWFRRCPRCSEPVSQGTTWVVTQNGPNLRIDRGLRGTIDGYQIQLEGIESNGFNRYDFYYSRLYLTPDGLRITGNFVGSERIQNSCSYNPPLVTCFANAGYIHAIRRSPMPTPFPPPPIFTDTPLATPSVTPVPTSTATVTPTSTTLPTSSPTQSSVPSDSAGRQYLPFILRPSEHNQ